MRFSWLPQLLCISGFLLLGYGIVFIFQVPLPGSVVGMILLFVSLLAGIVKIEWIEQISSFQMRHLTMLFIPFIVSVFISSKFQEILQWNVLIILIVSSICCLLGSAFAVEWYEKIKRKEQ
ncbi:CidA/LrgA family protein [Alkalihalobacillus sp. BA299]|uniref:CidA/LrgA family protein n=1 Tax=Alkalihalobacillus sp. BA299 TaxID=2815938 RepID=UPI0027DD5557|nr:CidA/LrgA family protein [Alkalihalobacillus sp. BA299]